MNGCELTDRHSQKASGGVILLRCIRTQNSLILPEAAVSDQSEPVDLNPGIELGSPELQVDFYLLNYQGSPVCGPILAYFWLLLLRV